MGLKILHTSDWHLGKRLFKIDRLDEQALFLKWLGDFILSENIDLLLVSGDIFDSPNPSNESIKLYFDFLKNLKLHSKCQTFIIAGNHDSGKFLDAPGEILKDSRVFVCGKLALKDDLYLEDKHKYTLTINDILLNLVLLPYFRGHEVMNLNTPSLDDSASLLHERMDLWFKNLHLEKNDEQFNILLLHHLFEGYELSGSEQMINLFGMEGLKKSLFTPYFDYVALGHIHKSMTLCKENPVITYSGAPIAYRFNEPNQKSITLLTIDSSPGLIRHTEKTILIPIFRQILSLKITASNYQKLITDILDQKNIFPLPPIIEISLSLDLPDSELINQIKKFMQDHQLYLYFLYCHFTRSENPSIDFDHSTDFHIDHLFDLYLKEKFKALSPANEHIIRSFHELLESTSHIQIENDEGEKLS